MTLMQLCSVEKYRPSTIVEALRSGDSGFGVEGHRHGMIKDEAQADK